MLPEKLAKIILVAPRDPEVVEILKNFLESTRCRRAKKSPAKGPETTIDYVGADHFLFASDIPHWDCEFPGNLEHLRNHSVLSDDVKEKILYKNAKQAF